MIARALPTRWVLKTTPDPAKLAAYRDTPPLIATLLIGRDIAPDAAPGFLNERGEPLADPMLLPGMADAVTRIRVAHARGEQICVYGDYDADGMTAQAVVVSALRAWGFPDVRAYTPHRENEGYGLHHAALADIADGGARLVIAVDCGISNAAEIARLRARDVDVIVLDHHALPAVLPEAAAVVNPRLPESRYPSRDLAGVGVAYALVRALAQSGPPFSRPAPALLNDLLAFVAIGTVADVVPLTGENRTLVRAGLRALRKTQHLGLRALCERAGVPVGTLDAGHIAYALAPRLNAPGRVQSVEQTYQLLLPASERDARLAAVALDEANRERQNRTQRAVDRAIAMIDAGGVDGSDRLLFVGDAEWSIGIVGLVAAKLVERYHRPALVYAHGPTASRGSARSIDGFNVIDALDDAADLLIQHGGHPKAAGFTVRSENLPALRAALIAHAAHLSDDDLAPRLRVDARLDHRDLSLATCIALSAFAPFGAGNAEPLFLVPAVRVQDAKRVGANGAHLSMQVRLQTGESVRCIAFGHGEREDAVRQWGVVDLAATLQRDVWQGDERLQLRVRDIRPAEI